MSTAAEAHPELGNYAGFRPQLKPGVETHRHTYRGRPWYVFHDRAAHRFFRVSVSGAAILSAMDGKRSLLEICEMLQSDADQRRAAAAFVGQLAAIGLLRHEHLPDAAAMSTRRAAERKRSLLQQIKSPLFFRIPLFDPTRMVDAALPWLAWVFGPVGIAIFLAVLVLGGINGLMHWNELTVDLTDRIFSAQNILIAWLLYPCIKALHEFGHALALRFLGVEVRQIGVLFAAFVPVPYVDASASSALPNKWQRILVDMAGILVEVFLGALALIIWASVEPGAVRAVCFNVIMISGFSTLLFNGNPLQRFDGYYALSDLIEIPGLATRSTQYINYLMAYYAMGRRELRAPEATPGEKWWFVIYGPLSFLYRVFLMLIIALHVAQMIPALGLLLAAWALVGYVWPAIHGAWRAFAQPGPKRPRAVVGVVGLTALGVGVALLPIPRNILVHGFVAVPEDSVLRPRVAATIAELLVPADAVVVAGQPIARLTDAAVETKVVRLEARQAELRARVIQETATDRVRAMGARDLLAQAERELADARRDQASLTLVSPAAGRLIFTIDTADLTGRFLQRGEQIAMIYRAPDAVVRTLAPMADIDALRSKLRAVALRPSYAPAEIMGAQIARISPATTDRLPSSTLSLEGGGPFAVTRESPNSWRMEEPAYEVEVRPDAPLPITFLNGRVHVRFSLGWEPAGLAVWRQARLLFMRQLHV